MLPDRVSNPGPLTYESGALSIALRGPAIDYPLKHPHIFLSNKLVDSHNSLVFETSPGSNKISIQALEVLLGDVSKEVKDTSQTLYTTGY